MISHIFNKTKPVNFLLLCVLLAVYILSYEAFIGIGSQDSRGFWVYLLQNIGFFLKGLALLVPALFLIDFILKRNKLVLSHSYTLFYFVVFCGLFPAVFSNTDLLMAHFFVLLGLRRILSLKTKQRSRKKVFEACLWFLVASFFYEWSLLYFIVLVVSIFAYDKSHLRYWALLLWAVMVYAALLWAFIIGSEPRLFFKSHYLFELSQRSISTQFTPLMIGFFGSSLVLVVWNFTRSTPSKIAALGRKKSLAILLVAALVSVSIFFIYPIDNHSALVFSFFPLAFLWSNTTELLPKTWQKEILMWTVLSAPLWGLLGYLIQN